MAEKTAEWGQTAPWRNLAVKQRRERGQELEGNMGLGHLRDLRDI